MGTIAKVEHFIVSTIASVIPESVRITVRGYWEAFKNRGKKELGEHEQEKVDMVGWGVEEAQERYEEKASQFYPSPPFVGNRTATIFPAKVMESICGVEVHWLTLFVFLPPPLGLATQLALAYAIHKSFIFVRLPLTAAVTPRVVKTLRSWGWNIGKPKPKV